MAGHLFKEETLQTLPIVQTKLEFIQLYAKVGQKMTCDKRNEKFSDTHQPAYVLHSVYIILLAWALFRSMPKCSENVRLAVISCFACGLY